MNFADARGRSGKTRRRVPMSWHENEHIISNLFFASLEHKHCLKTHAIMETLLRARHTGLESHDRGKQCHI